MFAEPGKQLCLASVFGLFSLVLCIAAANDPTPPASGTSDRVPIQAQLVGPLDATRAKVGDTVYAKVRIKWQSKEILLREGTILVGHVVARTLHSKTSKTAEIALLFDTVEYTKVDRKPLNLTLEAVLAAEDSENISQYRPLSEQVGVGTGSGGALGNSPGNALRSVTAAAANAIISPGNETDDLPKSILPGQVSRGHGMKLAVETGPEGSSVLSKAGHNVRLESGSLLVFLPKPNNPAPAASPSAAAAQPNPASAASTDLTQTPAASETSEQTEICTPPECSIALDPSEAEVKTNATSTTSLKELGYLPPVNREMYGFNHEVAIAYLGAKELLLTFNPHTLFKRSKEETTLPKLHIVRAVLMDVAQMRVEQTLDWRVQDANQYLWTVGSDRILVHVGRELRLYGARLKELQRFALEGPLEFVSLSPDSKFIAVGTLQERHSVIVHRELAEAEGREPEEDVTVKVLDADLHLLAEAMQSSRMPHPVLSDQGEIRVYSLGKDRWRIRELDWSGQKRVVAQFSSSCRPAINSFPPNLLFVVGCDRQAGGQRYRMLRLDGKPVLTGWSPSSELEHAVMSGADGTRFALGLVKATKSLAPGVVFVPTDLDSQQISVYGSKDGHRLFATRVASPAPSQQTFALSSDGTQLAVLGGEKISFYEVPAALEPSQ